MVEGKRERERERERDRGYRASSSSSRSIRGREKRALSLYVSYKGVYAAEFSQLGMEAIVRLSLSFSVDL